MQKALDSVSQRSLDETQVEGLIGNLTALEKEAHAELKEARLLGSSSTDSLLYYNNLGETMAKANTSKADALQIVQGKLSRLQKSDIVEKSVLWYSSNTLAVSYTKTNIEMLHFSVVSLKDFCLVSATASFYSNILFVVPGKLL